MSKDAWLGIALVVNILIVAVACVSIEYIRAQHSVQVYQLKQRHCDRVVRVGNDSLICERIISSEDSL